MVEAKLSMPGAEAVTAPKPRVPPLREDYSDTVTNMFIGDVIGTPQLGKRGITDEEKEKTN